MRRQVTFPLKDNSWKGKYLNGSIFAIPGTYIYIKQEPRECLSHGQKLSAQIRGHFWFSSLGKQSNIQVIALISDLICYLMLFLFYSNETVISDAVCLQNRPHGPDFRPVFICIMTWALLNMVQPFRKLFNCFQRNALSSNESKGNLCPFTIYMLLPF